MSKERERIIVKLVDGTVAEGYISLHGRVRVVDTLNHPEPFFNLREVEIKGGDSTPLMMVSKRQVVSVRHVTPPDSEINGTVVLRKSAQRNVFDKKSS